MIWRGNKGNSKRLDSLDSQQLAGLFTVSMHVPAEERRMPLTGWADGNWLLSARHAVVSYFRSLDSNKSLAQPICLTADRGVDSTHM